MTTGNERSNAAGSSPEATPPPASGMHVGAAKGRLERALASQLEIKAGEDAGLHFGIFRSSFPPGTGMPFLHVHRSSDEAFCVLKGEVQFQLGAQEIQARAGSAVLIPAGVPHCFRNVGSDDVDWLVITSPASLVTAIEQLAQLAPGDIDALAELMERHDSELLERDPHWGPPATAASPT